MDDYRQDIKAALDDLMLVLPDTSAGHAFGYPAYKIGRKVFAFVGGEGFALKLTESRVEELLEDSDDDALEPFQPKAGVTWQAWLSINAEPEAVADYLPLIQEAHQTLRDNTQT